MTGPHEGKAGTPPRAAAHARNAVIFDGGRETLRSGAGFRTVAGRGCLKTNNGLRGRMAARWRRANLSSGGTRRRDSDRLAADDVHFLTLRVCRHALRQNTQRRRRDGSASMLDYEIPALSARWPLPLSSVWCRGLGTLVAEEPPTQTFQHRRQMCDEAALSNRLERSAISRASVTKCGGRK